MYACLEQDIQLLQFHVGGLVATLTATPFSPKACTDAVVPTEFGFGRDLLYLVCYQWYILHMRRKGTAY